MADIVKQLQDGGRGIESDWALSSLCVLAAAEIERLREKCNKQAMVLRRLNPENFPNTYFICGEMGEKDQNGMPAKIMVAPAYGVDFSYEYVYNGRVTGPEW